MLRSGMVEHVGVNISTSYFKYEDESSLWKAVGKELLRAEIPSTLRVNTDDGTAVVKIAQRGTYKENGEEKPSMYVTVSKNTIDLPASQYKEAFLTCVHPESNNYKAYVLKPTSAGISADYGSIDDVYNGKARTLKTPYESYLYWIRYYEKLSKGYVDQSDIVYENASVDTSVKTSVNTLSENPACKDNVELYALLKGYAHQFVQKTLVSVKVTRKQIDKSREIWYKLGTCVTVESFNKYMSELVAVSPRKRDQLHDNISRYFAKTTSDFSKIIDFEESLIYAMEAEIGSRSNKNSAVIMQMFGDTEVYLANNKQKEEVMRMLGDSALKSRVTRIWRIKNKRHEKRFAEYCKQKNITTIRKFWHGSKNQNWASIIENGLLLNPNAPITGKMFGQGIYFAPSPMKSYGYTSCYGSCWARGNSPKGFMGIYATAYGNPYMATHWGTQIPELMKQNGKDCVHATPANTGLRNDEVIFYDESAIVMNYLVELEAS